MQRYLFRRVWQGAIAVFGVLLIIFVAQRLSGDPVALMLPMDASEEDYAVMRSALGLDRPLHVQLAVFLSDAITGDFGTSYQWRAPAMRLLIARLPATLELALAGLFFALLLALPLGVLSAVYRGRWIDNSAQRPRRGLGAIAPIDICIQRIPLFSLSKSSPPHKRKSFSP